MKLKCVFTLFLAFASLTMQAQLRYGFKTGLNFATIKGESELGPNGANLETWNNATGFQIGITLGYPVTDHFGVRGELMYSKKGAKYIYDGPSYKFFRNSTTTKFTTGNAKYLINITNSYLDIPIMASVTIETTGTMLVGTEIAAKAPGDGYTLVIGLRSWEFAAFTAMRRDPSAAAPAAHQNGPRNR